MIAADSSSLIAYLQGMQAEDTQVIDRALANNLLYLPPVVVTEVLSSPRTPPVLESRLSALPKLELKEGYWQRAAKTRSLVLSEKRKARLADTLIAQSCLDHDTALVTRDNDFNIFAKLCGLRLINHSPL